MGAVIEIPELIKASAGNVLSAVPIISGAEVPEQRPIVGERAGLKIQANNRLIIFLQEVQHQKAQEH